MINEVSMIIWGREFSLPVEYRIYDNEPVSKEQQNAVDVLSSHPEWVEQTKNAVEEYCWEQVIEDADNEKKDNIFSYIKPEYLFVKHEAKPRVAIMCKYRYDMEHGLAVVFSADGDISIGPQDIIL